MGEECRGKGLSSPSLHTKVPVETDTLHGLKLHRSKSTHLITHLNANAQCPLIIHIWKFIQSSVSQAQYLLLEDEQVQFLLPVFKERVVRACTVPTISA